MGPIPENVRPLVGILTGPTATGKTSLALELAQKYQQIEIINADSMLVYRGMDIGTAKPTSLELKAIPHHLIDICEPNEPFTAGEFLRAAQSAIDSIHGRGRRALIVGGTGFYLKALLFGTWEAPAADSKIREKLSAFSNESLHQALDKADPKSALRIGPSDRYRLIRALELCELTGKTPTQLQESMPKEPDPRFRLWIMDRPKEELDQRIQQRTQQMIQQGLIQEFEKIQARFPESRALSAVGYAQVSHYLTGQTPPGRKIKPGLDGLADEIALATRQLVKNQRTWFRNQSVQVPYSQWYHLDKDRSQLEEAFKSVYEQEQGHPL
jgi:tRNA dimethylallyltransferase